MRLLSVSFFLIICCIVNAQDTSCWQILVYNKPLIKSNLHKTQTTVISRKEKGSIKLVYNCDSYPEEWNRTFLIMNSERRETGRFYYENKENYVEIPIIKLKEITGEQTFTLYTTGIPKDSLIARTWRVKPVLLTTIQWQ